MLGLALLPISRRLEPECQHKRSGFKDHLAEDRAAVEELVRSARCGERNPLKDGRKDRGDLAYRRDLDG